MRDHDDAMFVQDLTVPDGTPMRPGQRFAKIWLIRNVGQQIWSSEYRLTHREGHRMGASPSIKLPRQVRVGEDIAVKVSMVAPFTLGSVRSEWQLQDASGQWLGEVLWADIDVDDG